MAPALFGSLVISLSVVALFLGDMLVAIGLPSGSLRAGGISGRGRLLQMLSFADFGVAAAMALAVALVVLQRQLPGEAAPVTGPRGGRVRAIALLAGAVAVLVALAALVRGIVSLTVPHQPGAYKVGELVIHLAVMTVAAASAWWALHNRW